MIATSIFLKQCIETEIIKSRSTNLTIQTKEMHVSVRADSVDRPKTVRIFGWNSFHGVLRHDIGGRPLARCSPGRGVRVRARAQLVRADMQKSVGAISYEELEVKGPSGPWLLAGDPVGLLTLTFAPFGCSAPCDPGKGDITRANTITRTLTITRYTITWVHFVTDWHGRRDNCILGLGCAICSACIDQTQYLLVERTSSLIWPVT